MEKKDLIDIIDNAFKPLGFKRKGNYWRLNGSELIKIINLQKSSFSNLYYINYGFDFVHHTDNEDTMHIFNRLHSLDKQENELIVKLLDFKNDTDTEIRKVQLTKVINEILKVELEKINSEKDIVREIKEKRILINMVPLTVKKYLNV